MNTYKIILTICILLLAGLSTAKAQNITLYQNTYSYSDGGEFTAYTNPSNLLSSYAPSATLNGGFETFCIESGVYFYPGTTYSYVQTDTESTGQKLTLGTAFLYNQFATGNLSGYDYTDTLTRQTDNSELQAALWAFQGQTIPDGFPSISTDPYYNLAITDLGGTSAAFDPSNGSFNVDILQLYDASGAPAQAQLGLMPGVGSTLVTPEPPTALLFIFAIALIVLWQIKQRRLLRI